MFTLHFMAEKENAGKGEYLAGKLLLAMPTLGDPRFHRAVILLCAHDENGAMGLVVNHILPGMEFEELLTQLKITSDIKIDPASLPVFCGGPVDGSRGFLLHSNDFTQSDTIKIGQDFSVTGTVEALKSIAKGQGPEDLLFILGYAGWSAGQLEQEIRANSWLVCDAAHEIIFEPDPEKKWERATRKMGIDPALLSMETGQA